MGPSPPRQFEVCGFVVDIVKFQLHIELGHWIALVNSCIQLAIAYDVDYNL